MATLQEAAQQAYQTALAQTQDPNWQHQQSAAYYDPSSDSWVTPQASSFDSSPSGLSQSAVDMAVASLIQQYGPDVVYNNGPALAQAIPGYDNARAFDQASHTVTQQQAALAGQDSPLERTLGQAVPLVIAAGGAYIGAGSGGFLDGAGAVGPAGYGGAGDFASSLPGASVSASDGLAGTLAGATGDATLIGNAGQDVIPSSNAGVGVEGGTTGTQAASTDLGGGLSVDQYGNVTGGQFAGGPGTAGGGDFAALGTDPVTGAAVAGTASGVAGGGTVGATTTGAVTGGATGTALSRVLDGTGTTADLLTVLGTAGITGLGITGANEQANALTGIYNDMAAKRQPFLDKSLAWLNDPSSYINGPGQTALQGVLRGLSVNGNPMGSGTSLGIATDAGLKNWQNAVTGFGNLGLAGEDTRAQVATGAANAQNSVYGDLGYGLGSLTRQPTSLQNFLRQNGLT